MRKILLTSQFLLSDKKNWSLAAFFRIAALILGILGCVSAVEALSEQQLQNGFSEKLANFMQTQGKRGTFASGNGVTIAYQRFDSDCNNTAVVVVPGWSEPYLKYAEVIIDLRDKGNCVYIMDHRGQGLSSRETENPQVGHVEDFSLYVRDLEKFVDNVLLPQGHRRLYILAHSMGGLVATLYAAEHPDRLDGLVMVAPMFSIDTQPWPQWLAYWVASGLDWLGMGASYVLGHGDWREKPFAQNQVTHSAVRFEYSEALLRNNKALAIGGVSNRWLKTSIEHTRKIRDIAPALNHKILLFQAEHDRFVFPDEINRFCESVRLCIKVFVPGARHEILMESDSIREPVMEKIYGFIEKP